MIILKIYYHIMAIIKKIFYKIIYGRQIKFGKKVTFRKGFSLVIEDNATVEIGKGTFFNNYCSINAKNNIKIGENCLFGENVKIYDHNHIFKNEKVLIKNQGFKTGRIEIKNNCWIGSNVVILKDVYIDKNCVIGAGEIIKNIKIDADRIVCDSNINKIRLERK